MSSPKKKLILLCGYLGSGKTSFIKYILHVQNRFKVAVIQNEYADEMGIESPLITDSQGNIFDKFYELPNGCICCSAKSDLLTAIDVLSKNSDVGYILIECNGLADPIPILQELWIDDNSGIQAELHCIITFAAAHRFGDFRINPIFQKQLIFSDLIVLNYTDKFDDDDDIVDIEEEIQILNPTAQIIQAAYSRIPIDLLFHFQREECSFRALKDLSKGIINHDHKFQDSIQSFYFNFKAVSFELEELERILGKMLWEKSDFKILRMKGLFTIKNSPFVHELQSMDDVFEVKETKQTIEHISLEGCKILVIGISIQKDIISNYFIQC